jgi:hypothetical protein
MHCLRAVVTTAAMMAELATLALASMRESGSSSPPVSAPRRGTDVPAASLPVRSPVEPHGEWSVKRSKRTAARREPAEPVATRFAQAVYRVGTLGREKGTLPEPQTRGAAPADGNR